MPKELEIRLRREAEKKGFSEERKDRYVYGSMRAMGWKPKRERGPKVQRRTPHP